MVKENFNPQNAGKDSGEEEKDLAGWQNKERKPGDKIEIRRSGGVVEEIPAEAEEPASLSRRSFLKKLLVGTGVAATGIGVKELFFDAKEKDDEGERPKEKTFEAPAGHRPERSGHVVDRLEFSIKERWMKGPRAEAIRRIKPQENMSAKEIAGEMLRLFEDKAERTEFLRLFPSEVFSTDLFLAQQFQESRGQKEAVSKSGARGVYQNFPASVIDCVSYLDAMRQNGLVPYRGPSRISQAEADKITDYFTKQVNYGRAAGKIYLQAIFNPVSGFNTGPNSNAFKGKAIKEIQGRLLAAYHDGPSARYKNDQELVKAAQERAANRKRPFSPADTAVHYRERVFSYMADAKLVRDIYRRLDLNLQFEDTAVDRMLHVFEKYGKTSEKEALVIRFKDILKLEKDKKGADLTRAEIINIFRAYL